MRDLQTPEWILDSEYPGLDSPEVQQDRQRVEELLETISSLSPGLVGAESLQIAQEMALLQKEAGILLYNLSSYAYLTRSTDIKNNAARELLEQLKKIQNRMEQALQPLEQYFMRAKDDVFEAFLAHPELRDSDFFYRHERSQHPYLLPLEQENLISGLEMDGYQAWGNLYTNLTGSIEWPIENEDGEIEKVGVARLLSWLGDSDEKLRRHAHEALDAAFGQHEESCAAILNSLAGWRLEVNRRRSHTQPAHFLGEALHSNRMQASSLDTMMQAVHGQRHLGQKALHLQAPLLGKTQLDVWDSQAPAPALDGNEQLISFPEAMDIIVAAFGEVDPSMGEFARMMQTNGWIDAAAQPHKTPGAFCSGFAKSRTPRVLMTYLGSQSNLITLAHELGHAFHSWVMRDMPYRETRYPMSLAETASTFAETVVRHYLLRQATTPAAQLAILWQEVASIPRFMLNIPVRYEFEKAFYTGRSQRSYSPDDFKQLMGATWRDWHGDGMHGSDDMFWATKLHFYIVSPSFYNFPYTFGYLFSQAIYAERGRRGDDFFAFYTALLRDTGRMSVEDLVAKHFEQPLDQPGIWEGCFHLLEHEYLQPFERLVKSLT